MAEKMPNAPIFFAATQVAFNEIRGMQKFVDEIQDRMRGLKYIDFKHSAQKNIQINVASPEISTQQTDITKWQFIDFENRSGFVLTQNSLFFQTTAYETSKELRANLIKGLKIVHEVVGLDYVQSIGVRTLDAVVPLTGESIARYLKTSLLGYSEDFSGKLGHSLTECIVSKPDGILIARAVILGPDAPAIGVPFDLYPIQLKFDNRFGNIKGHHAVLDNDRRQHESFAFDLDEIEKRIITLKKNLSEAFHTAITEHAKKIWGQK